MEFDEGVHKSLPHGGLPQTEPPPEPPRRTPSRWLRILAIAVLLICMIGGGILLYTRFQHSTQNVTATPSTAAIHFQWCVNNGAQPDISSFHSQLSSVAAISRDDVWAVGSEVSNDPNSGASSPLIEHWDGTRWKSVPDANIRALFQSLANGSKAPVIENAGFTSIAGISANDIWAVGSITVKGTGSSPFSVGRSLIEHWDGNTWKVVESPNARNQGVNFLTNVKAVSTHDIWAVGYTFVPNVSSLSLRQSGLVEHWDGSRWNLVQIPASFQGGILRAVTATSPNDVWVAGFTAAATGSTPFLAHWNGQSWSIPLLPAALTGSSSIFQALIAISARDVWAIGGGLSSNENDRQMTPALIMHWDGLQWRNAPGLKGSFLASVAVDKANDIWAVGSTAANQALIEHWDGQKWSVVLSQSFPANLSGVAVSGGKVWAVGAKEENNNGQISPIGTLIETSC